MVQIPPELTPLQSAIKVLSAYKELITILVFFLGGLSWILGYFATKQQATELRCLLDRNVELLDSQMQLRFLQDELVDIGRDLEEFSQLESKAPLTDAQKKKRMQISITSKQTSQRRDEANKVYVFAKAAIQRSDCAPK